MFDKLPRTDRTLLVAAPSEPGSGAGPAPNEAGSTGPAGAGCANGCAALAGNANPDSNNDPEATPATHNRRDLDTRITTPGVDATRANHRGACAKEHGR